MLQTFVRKQKLPDTKVICCKVIFFLNKIQGPTFRIVTNTTKVYKHVTILYDVMCGLSSARSTKLVFSSPAVCYFL